MSINYLFAGNNTNLVHLTGLASGNNNAVVNDATVIATLKDKNGIAVAGMSWPVVMDYVAGSQGDYQLMLSNALNLAENGFYSLIVQATAPSGIVGTWLTQFRALRREAS